MSPFINLTTYSKENSRYLARKIIEDVLHKMKLTISEQEKEAAISMYETLMRSYGKEGVPEELIKWSKRNAKSQVSSGSKISEIVVRYPPTREVFADLVLEWSLEFNLTTDETIWVLRKINEVLDISLKETVSAFEQLSKEIRNQLQKEVEELSAPLVPVKEGIFVLPFVGIVDSNRTKHLLEKVVPKISELQINYLIVDFSGVPSIDEETARNLHEIELVLRLLGTQVIATGISPILALTVTRSGIDSSDVTSFANVKQALKTLN